MCLTLSYYVSFFIWRDDIFIYLQNFINKCFLFKITFNYTSLKVSNTNKPACLKELLKVW